MILKCFLLAWLYCMSYHTVMTSTYVAGDSTLARSIRQRRETHIYIVSEGGELPTPRNSSSGLNYQVSPSPYRNSSYSAPTVYQPSYSSPSSYKPSYSSYQSSYSSPPAYKPIYSSPSVYQPSYSSYLSSYSSQSAYQPTYKSPSAYQARIYGGQYANSSASRPRYGYGDYSNQNSRYDDRERPEYRRRFYSARARADYDDRSYRLAPLYYNEKPYKPTPFYYEERSYRPAPVYYDDDDSYQDDSYDDEYDYDVSVHFKEKPHRRRYYNRKSQYNLLPPGRTGAAGYKAPYSSVGTPGYAGPYATPAPATTTAPACTTAATPITLSVIDGSTNAPITGAAVTISDGGTNTATGTTDASGTFVTSAFPPGTYTVTVSATGYYPVSGSFTNQPCLRENPVAYLTAVGPAGQAAGKAIDIPAIGRSASAAPALMKLIHL